MILIFERFTDRARRVLVLAQEEARLLDHNYLGTEHVLLGLLNEGEGVAGVVLKSLGVDLAEFRAFVKEATGNAPSGPNASGAPPFTPRTKKVLEFSLREALQLGHNYIGTEHLLLGLIREGEGLASQLLREHLSDEDEPDNEDAALMKVRYAVIDFLSGYEKKKERGEPAEPVKPHVVVMRLEPSEADEVLRWLDAYHSVIGTGVSNAPELLRKALLRGLRAPAT